MEENSFRILIIDDNPAIHKDFIKILTVSKQSDELSDLDKKLFGSRGSDVNVISLPKFQIDTANQGEEGVIRIKQAIEEKRPYALAFVDIRMPPGWDGIETIKHIWKLDQDIQIVICTAYSDYSWEETTKQLGMTDNLLILKKPFDNVAVRQLTCALTKKWQLMHSSRDQTKFLEKSVEERTRSLQRSLSLTKATLESSKDGILVVANNNKIVDYNNQFIEMWKIPPAIIEAKKIEIIIEYVLDQLKNPDKFLQNVNSLKNKSEEINFDVIKFKDGRIYELHIQPHKLGKKTIGRVWSFRDVTNRIYLETELEHLATHDPLTNLPNRALLTDRIHRAIEFAKRNNSSIAILYIDLDRFKLVNDSLTHAGGDKLLQAVAERLLSINRAEDTVGRLGGDEFVLVAEISNDYTHIINLAEKLLNSFRKPFYIMNRKLVITASIGISFYPIDGKTPEELLSNADLAMYYAKNSGADQFQFYTNEMNKKALQRFENESELRLAIEKNQFFLCYQPQFDLLEKRIISVEALIRWKHPKKGLILPLDFIPLAEETGLIVPIGEWVLRTACKQNKVWQESGIPPIRVAVNVATRQFRQTNFVQLVKNILKETGLKPEFLEIEITENAIITGYGVLEAINELKNMNVQITLDDFGVGNSSLNYLRKINLDRLKIDQSFIQNIDHNRNNKVIIDAILSMAHGLNLEVLAEGVETQNQLNYLQKKHCQKIQGFYLSKPLDPHECEKLLQEYNPQE